MFCSNSLGESFKKPSSPGQAVRRRVRCGGLVRVSLGRNGWFFGLKGGEILVLHFDSDLDL